MGRIMKKARGISFGQNSERGKRHIISAALWKKARGISFVGIIMKKARGGSQIGRIMKEHGGGAEGAPDTGEVLKGRRTQLPSSYP